MGDGDGVCVCGQRDQMTMRIGRYSVGLVCRSIQVGFRDGFLVFASNDKDRSRDTEPRPKSRLREERETDQEETQTTRIANVDKQTEQNDQWVSRKSFTTDENEHGWPCVRLVTVRCSVTDSALLPTLKPLES